MKHFESALHWLDAHESQLIQNLLTCVNINSGTFNYPGLIAQQKVLDNLFEPLSDKNEVISLPALEWLNDDGQLTSAKLGPVLRYSKRPNAKKQVLLCGHMDTVFSIDSPFQAGIIEGDKLIGPGAADMKGGLMVMYAALAAFEQYAQKHELGWEVVINPDEEIGSLGSVDILKQAAQGKDFGLVYEAALDQKGTLAGARKGSGKINLVVHGKAAHAGRDFDKGVNANIILAELILKLHALNGQRAGLTINVGKVNGGEAANMVSGHAVARIDVRYEHKDDQAWLVDALNHMLEPYKQNKDGQVQEQVYFTREPKFIQGSTQKLYDEVINTAGMFDQKLTFSETGGVCDGNILSSVGLANVDTLGVLGSGTHTESEFMIIKSLLQRAKISALLLMRYASNEWSL